MLCWLGVFAEAALNFIAPLDIPCISCGCLHHPRGGDQWCREANMTEAARRPLRTLR